MFKKCKHDFESLGCFYKEKFSEYRNRFDEVNIYRKEKCTKCGLVQDVLLISESFMPQLFEKIEGTNILNI